MIGAVLRLGPVLAVGAVLLAAAGGGWWIAATVAERDRLAAEAVALRASVDASDTALAESEAHHQAVVDALARAHAQTARLVARSATILEDLRHATAPDCPVPRAVRDAVDRLWPPAE
ncbi:hypothetical protein [Roseospira visakhapatnamensis]|uniref:Uncharacterized protein n=1 Tax=Roseospira visakhapatnamensis TaxID=390880 RepID=A0A7W6W9T6_9PROT|nr:hypothetical protein [Roseospira visakhapatnamensis]MBB4266284.1 hypothetical protein [Roseospira visakhapatnamensis]